MSKATLRLTFCTVCALILLLGLTTNNSISEHRKKYSFPLVLNDEWNTTFGGEDVDVGYSV